MRLLPAALVAMSVAVVACSGSARGVDTHASGEGARSAAAPSSGGRARLAFYKDPAHVPSVTLKALDGRTLSSSDWRGKVTLVNFWATWCPPCRAEIPDLIALQEKYPEQLRIIGISEDEAPEEVVKAFVAAHKINYQIAMTNPEVEKAFPGIGALPTTFVLDKDGRVVQRHVGMLTAATTELEARALAGLPVNATIEEVDRAQPLKMENAAQLKSIPGVDLASLSPEQRAAALQKLNSEPCTCGCDLTVARCRVEDPSCGISLPLARKIVQELGARR